MPLVSLQMRESVSRNDIFSLKWKYYDLNGGIFYCWGTLKFVYYPIIFYQRMKVYRVETKGLGIFRWINGVSGKYNPRKYYITYCAG